MAKRKGSAAESNTNKKMKKEVAKNGIENGKKGKVVDSTTKLDFSSGENVIKSLLGNTDLSKFFDEFWEKKHLLVKREQKEYYGELFSFAAFKEMLKEQELEFESDVNVCRYLNNEKELLNEDGTLTVEKCEELWKGKNATFQLHQPQRYSEILWKLMEKMETYFGCLVGSNVYMTPKGSQGLAPHCDDIEVFILQLEGSKKWKLYKPMVELSRDYTLDLPQDSIGEPFIETILEPGDMLYFPRGTIHQAETVGDSHSTHITLSTYQHNTLGDFLNTAVTQAIENALENDVSFRRGLPLNYFSYLGTQTNFGKYVEESDEKKTLSSNENDERVKKFKENIKAHLSMLIDHIDVDVAADSMSQDFVASRLPPFGHVVKEEEDSTASPPELKSKVKLRYPQHVRVMYIDCEEEEEEDEDETIEEDEDEEEEEPEEKPAKGAKKKRESLPEEDEEDADADLEDDGPCIKLMHSLNNDKQTHMSNTPVLDDMVSLKFPVHYAQALTHLMQAKGEFVSVKDLPLEEDDEKLQFAVSLFSDDLIEIKS